MKTAVFATLLASAAAFAPVSQKASTTALNAFENELGVQQPVSVCYVPICFSTTMSLTRSFSSQLGYWDPLGLGT